jgi:hypothetical protein
MRVANDDYGMGPNGCGLDRGWGRRPGRGEAGEREAADACLLWCLRRLVQIPPGTTRCPMVHITLQRQFGDAGLGIEHLLRCLVMGLAMHSSRRLAFGLPGCPLRTDDEIALLALITDGDFAPYETAAALAGVGGAAAAVLQPLVAALRQWLKPGG